MVIQIAHRRLACCFFVLVLACMVTAPAWAYFQDYGQEGVVAGNGVASRVVQITDPEGPSDTIAYPGGQYFPDPWSPDSGWVLYSSDTSLYEGEIHKVRVNGQDDTRLTDNSGANDTNAQFSADGAKIVWQSGSEIWAMDADGSNEAKIADGEFPIICPDGSKVAYVNTSDQLAVQGFPSGGVSVWTTTDFAYGLPEYVWSPDSQWIAYRTSTNDIYKCSSSQNLQLLDGTVAYAYAWPCFSPDGSKIAYVRRHDDVGYDYARIYEKDADEYDPQEEGVWYVQVVNNTSASGEDAYTKLGDGCTFVRLSYSRDGRFIFYQKIHEADGHSSLFAFDRRQGGEIQLTQTYDDAYPVVSPNGRWVFFEEGDTDRDDVSSTSRSILLLRLLPRNMPGVMNMLLQE